MEKESASEPAEIRAVSEVRSDTQDVSSEILNIIALIGEVSEPGPGVGACPGDDTDSDQHFMMRHTWSISSNDEGGLATSMESLRDVLPEKGWEIVSYGPNKSRARTLTLVADHPARQFGINIQLWDKRKEDATPMILVSVASACYQVPAGQTVEHY
ncbi:hypothetical protein [Streptomyces sp. WMMC1477]|uniref:hypothetical protein n=1 Tax=Streptomyces sp. WMMC1477 TaxID=3015155 RepID=UPI0022B67835|nr:hypothetical protein [Streptomyces sp. WMMC1477]MCZ7433848.1 hypothetical protein [Streptomyces sp. WMMC1477]